MPPRKERVTLKCEECGSEFQLLACQTGRGRGRFCSKECRILARRRGEMTYCALCDTPFYRKTSEQDADNHFCSRKCYMEWRVLTAKPDTYLKVGSKHIHRIVAVQVLGRPLLPKEVVHHKDLNKQNNDPSNLAVFPDQATHVRCHSGEMSDDELRRFSIG